MNDEQELLTNDERDYFQKMEALFNSDGWALLAKELQDELDDLPTRGFAHAKNWDEVLAGRAAETKMREFLAYPEIIEQRKHHLLEERRLMAEEAEELNRPDV